jgi:hypothetical protein
MSHFHIVVRIRAGKRIDARFTQEKEAGQQDSGPGKHRVSPSDGDTVA